VLGDILPGSAGEGYGHDLRTPHNFAIYLLGYTGLIGCGLYLMVLLAILRDLLRWPSSDAKDAALAAGASVIIMAVSGNLLETPFGAVPTYISIGILMTIAERQAMLVSPANGIRDSRLYQRLTTSAGVMRQPLC
jgi:O-antigen ligase